MVFHFELEEHNVKTIKEREILSTAHNDGRRTVEGVTRQLKKEFPNDKRKNRNWEQVARTELTDAKGKASFSLVQQIFGVAAKVYRSVGENCCEKCCALFGKPGKEKVWRADQVPQDAIGAVHPNCDCGPWKAVDRPDLTKALDPLAEVPLGIVKRMWDTQEKEWVALVSTGTGYWTRLDSITGRSIVQVIATHMPVIKLKEPSVGTAGFSIFVHGTGHTKNKKQAELYKLSALSGARFYPMDFTDDKFKMMKEVRTMDDYLSYLKNVMPQVAVMNDYWENDKQLRWLTDFFGFKTMTDWMVVVPGKVHSKNKLKTVTLSVHSIKKQMRTITYKLLEGASLKKCGY